jgi:signal transduction histidine kinase
MKAMTRNSLSLRLFLSAAAWALVVLPATAFILTSVYRSAVERNFDARLNTYLTNLVANLATALDPAAPGALSLGEPLFSLPLSGWYWQIMPLRPGEKSSLASESLLDQKLELPDKTDLPADQNLTRKFYSDGPENQHLRVLERVITLQEPNGAGRTMSVAVAGDSGEIEDTISEFRNLLVVALTILGLGLAVATFFQVRFGLQPLRSIERGLAAIRSGDAETLEGDLPIEVQSLQRELNALIHSNHAIVERARTHAGNLAHALKTPLSVITNEAAASRSRFASKILEQAGIMRDQISHHLDRASIAAQSGIISRHTSVTPVLEALIRTLERIYADRKLEVKMDCPDHVVFLGEKHDLEEMVGNLADNACKWAKRKINLAASTHGKHVIITVADDGPGLSKKERDTAMKRGKRLDETQPGSGLGMSIVAELADLYGGSLSLRNRKTGGLKARLELPGTLSSPCHAAEFLPES